MNAKAFAVAPPDIVLVTGGTGFLGQWVVKLLLDRGYNVRATVRDLKNTRRYEFLYTVSAGADKASGRLSFHQCELASEAGWDDAMRGCRAVVHVAGVINLDTTNARKDLIEPTLMGVRNIFGAAARVGTVKRIVVTSSFAAVSEDFAEFASHTYDSNDWNTKSSEKFNAYAYSKTLEEKASWEYVRHSNDLSLTTICPSSIFGPALNDNMGYVNREIIFRLLKGRVPTLLDINLALCDVRDCAAVHVAALESPDSIDKRYICTHDAVPLKDIFACLAAMSPRFKRRVPTLKLPTSLVLWWARIFISRGTFQNLKSTLGKRPVFNLDKEKAEIAMELRPWEETVRDSAQWLIDHGLVTS